MAVRLKIVSDLLINESSNHSDDKIVMNRVWAMPNKNTFEIKPIAELLNRYIKGKDQVVVDAFARDSTYGTITNDINPSTKAQYHMDAVDFLTQLVNNNVKAKIILCDPPYSPRQITECYKTIGRIVTTSDTQNAKLYSQCKELYAKILEKGGIAISFGWNSGGLGKKNGCRIIEILLVAHGSAHNDTIVTVEIKD
jgi:hypothetical protein